MDVLDLWVNLVTPESASQLPRTGRERAHPRLPRRRRQRRRRHRPAARRDGRARRRDRRAHARRRDRARAKSLDVADAHPGRFLVAGVVHEPAHTDQERAPHPRARRGSALLPGARVAARDAGRHRRPEALPRLPGVRGARDPGRDQRRHPGPARAVTRAAPGAARGRADRLPRPRRDRRAHGASRTKSSS